MKHLLLAGTVLAFSFCSIAPAQEWTRFRGPNGSGVGANIEIPSQWKESDYHWKVQLPGSGHSSPVLWGQKLFLTATDDASARRMVLCIDARTGKSLWKKEFDSQTYRQHKENSYASSTPTVDAERVYLVWSTPEEYAVRSLDHEGKELWKSVLGPYVSPHGSGTSPILYKDTVIVTGDQEAGQSYVVALDKATGKVKWKTPRKPGNMAAMTPCILEMPGEAPQLIVASRTEGMSALDPDNGKVIWQVADAYPLRAIASPAVYKDILIGNCGEGPLGRHLIAIRAGTTDRKPKVLFKKVQADNPPYVPSPVVKDGLLFTWSDKGFVTCMDVETGKHLWQERTSPRDEFFTSPVLIADRLFNISKRGDVVVVRASDKYESLGRTTLDEQCYATPAVANGRMYVRTLTHLICVGGQKDLALVPQE